MSRQIRATQLDALKTFFLYCDVIPPHFALSIFRASEELAVKLGEKVGGS